MSKSQERKPWPIVFLAVAAVALCGAACRGGAEPSPGNDIPRFGLGTLSQKVVGPGGVRETYTTQSDAETVKAFFREQLPPRGWKPAGDAAAEDAEMLYYRKDTRLLTVYVTPNKGELGCNYAVSESAGERPPGNVAYSPSESP
ncbi:hypothetical protein K8I61_16500 [bacterium]|nr:hypothetical protein [bacterium]